MQTVQILPIPSLLPEVICNGYDACEDCEVMKQVAASLHSHQNLPNSGLTIILLTKWLSGSFSFNSIGKSFELSSAGGTKKLFICANLNKKAVFTVKSDHEGKGKGKKH